MDKNTPLSGFPMDVKNVEVTGCKKFRKRQNKNFRINITPNAKYSSVPFPNKDKICRGKVWNTTNEITEIQPAAPSAMASAFFTRS